MRTKEEIMDTILAKKPINYEIEKSEILECMDEYAKEVFREAISCGLDFSNVEDIDVETETLFPLLTNQPQ